MRAAWRISSFIPPRNCMLPFYPAFCVDAGRKAPIARPNGEKCGASLSVAGRQLHVLKSGAKETDRLLDQRMRLDGPPRARALRKTVLRVHGRDAAQAVRQTRRSVDRH